jgi:hypothetical protein
MSFVQQPSHFHCVITNIQDIVRAKDSVSFRVDGSNLVLVVETNKTSNRAKMELDDTQARLLLTWLQDRLK